MAPGRILLARARLVLALEGAFAVFGPAIAWGGGCLALFLTGWLPELSDELHLTLLASLLTGFVWLSIRALRRCHWPGRAVVLRRIEAESGLTHRPFAALEDRLTDGDAVARALWRAHLDRVERQIGRLRAGWPRAGLAVRDPFGLRAPILLCLLLAILHAGGSAPDHLRRSLWPFASATPPIVLDAWITPPAYTAAAPIYLATAASGDAFRAPVGSILTAQMTGSRSAPVLRQDDGAAVFARVGDRHFRLERQLSAGTALAVEAEGRTIAAWRMAILPDAPPEATIFPPQVNRRQHVRFAFQARDDYGVQSAILTLRRPDEAVDGALRAAPIELPLPIAAGSRLAEGGSYHDFTGHIWAGLPVQAQIVAGDGAGQQGESGWIDLTLPERSFRHPVARALIALRKRLILEPGEIDRHRAALARIAGQPQLYGQDAGIFLTLIVAALRLDALPPHIAAEQAQALLWSLAVTLEDGASGQREAELRQAEQALRAALASKASPELLQQSIANMQAALDRYLQAPGKHLPGEGQARAIGRDDLQQILEAAGILAGMGQGAQAQALLDRLRQILDSLAVVGDDAGGEETAARQILQTLQNLSRRQRALMARNAMPGAASSQQELSRQLGELMRQLDADDRVLEALTQAGQAMRQANEALHRGRMHAAEAAQGQALDRIGQAAHSLIEQIGQEQAWQSGGRSVGRTAGRDPLGRNSVPGSDVVIPDNNQIQRMRDVFEELRRRAAESGRPAIERDYLDRLLRPF